MLRAGLNLKPSDSAVYIPSWQVFTEHELQAHPSVQYNQASPSGWSVQMADMTFFPLHLLGIKVLGCPLCTEDYCNQLVQSLISKIDRDLTCLLAFPPLHQRIELAIYCCNTRIMYLLRALPLATSDRHLQQYDTMFDNFMAQTLAFEDNYAHCQYSLYP